MSKDLRRRMSDAHEAFVAKLFETVVNRGSGNQWNRQMDGRTDVHRLRFAFAWDCKATRAASITMSEAIWDKAVEQAGYERPMVPLRFYHNDHLTSYTDLVVIDINTLHELMEAANDSA